MNPQTIVPPLPTATSSAAADALPVHRARRRWTPARIGLYVFLLCAAALGYGLYLLIPQFHK